MTTRAPTTVPVEQRLTDRQIAVLRALWTDSQDRNRGLMAWQVRDRIYPADSPMRTKRTAGRGASSFNGSVGALGNLAAGRILHGLAARGYCWQPGAEYRWQITAGGAGALGYYVILDGSFAGMTYAEFDVFYADLMERAEAEKLCPNCMHTLACDAAAGGCHTPGVDMDLGHECPPNPPENDG